MTVRVALDAMGGDKGSEVLIAGARVALERIPDLEVRLVGRSSAIEPLLGQGSRERLSVVDCGEVVEMHEHPAMAVRQKRDSSVVVGHRQVAEGAADAFVSAGNSGASLAAAIFVLGRIRGIQRPALGTLLPLENRYTYLLDVGANIDCKPEWLVQFAAMGSAYARSLLGITRPTVAVLSNGEEEGKGPELVQQVEALLRQKGVPGAEFLGLVEGNHLLEGRADVVVTDGFTGNAVVKTMEGTAEHLLLTVRRAARGSVLATLGGLLLRPSLRRALKRADWREFAGAPLVGVNGVSVVAHGRSDALAISNAIRVGAEAARKGLVATITAELGAAQEAAAPAAATT